MQPFPHLPMRITDTNSITGKGVNMKKCSKCSETKSDTEFSRVSVARGGGLDSRCKACARAAAAAWRAANLERAKAANAAWRAANPERKKADSAAWYAANSDRVKAKTAAWRAANPECAKANHSAWDSAHPGRRKAIYDSWKTANPERIKAHNAKWRAANPEKVKARSAKWEAANPEARRIHTRNRRARRRESGGRLSKGLSAKLFMLQRGKCACGCKQSLGDDYHMDHRMPLALGGANEDWNMQLLRAKCNLQKSAHHPVDFMQQQRGLLL